MIFSETVFGKIVLAGEHAVLRGGGALVIPSYEHEMILEWTITNDESESIKSFGDLSSLILKAQQWILKNDLYSLALQRELKIFPKLLSLKSTIPKRAGLGSSAALCVLISKMMLSKSFSSNQDREKVIELATELENSFHGKSSGMDVVAVVVGRPLYIKSLLTEKKEIVIFEDPKLFHFKLIDTGLRSQTKECVEKVNTQWSESNFLKMQAAVECGLEAFKKNDQIKMSESMDLSLSLYREWGLIPEEVENLILKLKAGGECSSIRLTGSGLGGFLVCLYS